MVQEKPERIKKTIALSTAYAVGIMVVGLLIFQFATTPLLRIFNASDEMLAIGIPALRIISFSFLGAGFGITASSVFQATGHGFLSLAVSVIRQLLVLLPVAYILSRSADWKFSGGHSPLRRFLRLQSVRCFCAMCTKRD